MSNFKVATKNKEVKCGVALKSLKLGNQRWQPRMAAIMLMLTIMHIHCYNYIIAAILGFFQPGFLRPHYLF